MFKISRRNKSKSEPTSSGVRGGGSSGIKNLLGSVAGFPTGKAGSTASQQKPKGTARSMPPQTQPQQRAGSMEPYRPTASTPKTPQAPSKNKKPTGRFIGVPDMSGPSKPASAKDRADARLKAEKARMAAGTKSTLAPSLQAKTNAIKARAKAKRTAKSRGT